MTAPPDLFKTLTTAGISTADAKVLAAAFPNEPEFLEGLEQVAQVLANLTPLSMIPPAGQPWKLIHEEMGKAKTPELGLAAGINAYPGDVAYAINQVLDPRVATLISQAAGKHKRKTDDYIRTLHVLGYHFKLNEVTKIVEVNGEEIDDFMRAKIISSMEDAAFLTERRIERSYLIDASRNRYHPIIDYLQTLKYDGGQHIKKLASYFTDKHNFFEVALRHWLIGSVGKVFAGMFNPMLVLEGRQRLGKSQFTKWLASQVPNYRCEGRLDPDDKDNQIRMLRYWIWEVKELGATTRRADREALKATLDPLKISVRKPYDHYDTVGLPISNFIGTVNNESGYLYDPTGHSRFVSVSLTDIDWRHYKDEVLVDKVWAEAMALYLAGETYEMSPDEQKVSDQINEFYEVDDVVEGALLRYFYIDPHNRIWWTPTYDIVTVLEDPSQGALRGSNARTLAGILMKKGCTNERRENMRRQRVRGWTGVSKI